MTNSPIAHRRIGAHDVTWKPEWPSKPRPPEAGPFHHHLRPVIAARRRLDIALLRCGHPRQNRPTGQTQYLYLVQPIVRFQQ